MTAITVPAHRPARPRRLMVACLAAAVIVLVAAGVALARHHAGSIYTWHGRTYNCTAVNAAPWFLPAASGNLTLTYPLAVDKGCHK